MKGYFKLEDNYIENEVIDFNKKRYVITFNIASIAIAFAIFFIFRVQSCPIFTVSSIIFIIAGYFFLVIIHELIHALFIWIFSRKRAHFKFSLIYASAGASDRYFDRSSYIVIALSPVIIISLFLYLLINLSSPDLYNGILLVLALNISSAIGDFYISFITATKEKETLVRDEGEIMHFYTQTT
jgi:hypothetical protein